MIPVPSISSPAAPPVIVCPDVPLKVACEVASPNVKSAAPSVKFPANLPSVAAAIVTPSALTSELKLASVVNVIISISPVAPIAPVKVIAFAAAAALLIVILPMPPSASVSPLIVPV